MFDYDPLRLAIDVRGTDVTGYELAALLRESDDVNLELAGENVIVAVFGMGETRRAAGRAARRGAARRGRAAERDGSATAEASRSRRRRPGASS